MTRHRTRLSSTAAALLAAVASAWTALAAGTEAVDFSRDILPVLSDNCFSCHGPDEGARKAKLRLDTQAGASGPGKSGELAVVPGQSAKSEIVRRLLSTDPDEVMPPPKSNRRLTTQQIDTVRRWVDSGATWGRHWSHAPPRRSTVPSSASGVATDALRRERNPIDAFVFARLAREGLAPSPPAPAETLVRRVTLDLTGLPPTPEEVDAFVRETAPDAYDRLVDRLLASPRYGERMAWDWLEAARYADSNGYQGDGERTMWPWRDWVVDALNRNLSFDQFTTWQLAGDLLPEATPEQRLATGFLRNHMINGEGGRIAEENRIDYLFDQTETVATVWLGATFNCTRCHDHKFDPYTQRDYYGLLALFDRTAVDGSGGDPQARPNLAVPTAVQTRRLGDLETKLLATVRATEDAEVVKFRRDAGRPVEESEAAKALPKEILGHLKVAPRDRDNGRLEKLAAHVKGSDPAYAGVLDEQRRTREERDAVSRSIPKVMVMEDLPKPRDTFILSRGSYLKPGAPVAAAVPAGLAPFPADATTNRLGLARWLSAPGHPLTARVTVNRSWQMFFGIGLVKTTEDFGVQGEKPSHPELLDWLATELGSSGWDMKHLHRVILTSAVYRQSSKVAPALAERDPENRLLARGPRFRMPSWMIRDAALAASGLATGTLGGAPVKPYQPPGIWEEATFGAKRYVPDTGEALYRRSVYVFWRRIIGPTLFFDVANRQTCTVRTPRTNVPLHALLTLNGTTYVEAARALAERVLRDGPPTPGARITRACRWVLGRAPTAKEQRVLSEGLRRHERTFAADPAAAAKLVALGGSARDPRIPATEHAAWTVLCSTILNLDEALTKE